MKKTAIFPGSFDPFTKGHQDIVLRGLNLFDKIIIALGHNSQKTRYFELNSMLDHIRKAFENNPSIKVITYNELTASLAKKHNANFLLRGLRNTTDFEYENSIAEINKHLNPDLESVFLITSPDYAYIRSSIVREVHLYGGDISDYLPYAL